jgi:hypothetical protein
VLSFSLLSFINSIGNSALKYIDRVDVMKKTAITTVAEVPEAT